MEIIGGVRDELKNVIKLLVAMILVLGYTSLHLVKENREYKRKEDRKTQAVNDTIKLLKEVYDKDLILLGAKMKQENGELLLERYIPIFVYLKCIFYS